MRKVVVGRNEKRREEKSSPPTYLFIYILQL